MIKFFKNIFKNILKNKSTKSEPLELYKDYVLAVDYDNETGKFIVRFCYIKLIHDNGDLTVNIPSINMSDVILEWVPSMNNFIMKDKVDELISIMKLVGTELPSVKGNITLSENFQKFER